MKVLVIGNGGREDAICKKISESPKLSKLYCSNGNAGTMRYATNVSLNTNEEILDFSKNNSIDLVIIGPEAPLCNGIVDIFKDSGIKIFGADKKSSQLEGSKDFAKKFMEKYDIPTAKYQSVTSKKMGEEILRKFAFPLVIKADGLCAGKGVKICKTENEAISYLDDLFDKRIFGDEAKKVVIEEFLSGEEASLMCFVSKGRIIPMESARDYKRIYDNDEGDNTGGVGCYSPSELFNDKVKNEIEKIIDNISSGLIQEELIYSGILFIGFMIENGKPKILEFNVRFGDPETEVVLHRLDSDLVSLIENAILGELSFEDLCWKKEKCLTVILTSKGYPKEYEKGKIITGIDDVDSDIYVYHNNTKFLNNNIYTDGGRVLSVTSLGDSLSDIRERIYNNITKINYEGMQFRTNIGIIAN